MLLYRKARKLLPFFTEIFSHYHPGCIKPRHKSFHGSVNRDAKRYSSLYYSGNEEISLYAEIIKAFGSISESGAALLASHGLSDRSKNAQEIQNWPRHRQICYTFLFWFKCESGTINPE